MNAKEFNEIISKIDVDEKTKEGILELIDVKTVSNMEPILKEIKAIQEKSDSGFKIITSEFKSESKRLEDKIETKTTMAYVGYGYYNGIDRYIDYNFGSFKVYSLIQLKTLSHKVCKLE